MKDYIIRRLIHNHPNKKYNYFYSKSSKKIVNKELLEKLNNIYIPPAYNDVKILLKKDILATGIDEAGRKQYIYSDYSKKKREFKKYNQLIKMSNNIISLKKKINKDMSKKDFDKNKLIAFILKLMDICNFRCGNKKYEKKYGSYGLTTLHKKHIKMIGNKTLISFIGKKGVLNECIIKNKKIQNIIKKIYSLSPKNDPYIFSIQNNNKNIKINIQDINKYLEKYNITSKDLRTWNANVIFLKNFKKEIDHHLNLSYYQLSPTKQILFKKKLIKNAILNTANSLHHTSHVCKSSYIYKSIIQNILNNEYIIKNLHNKDIIIEKFMKKILNNK
jgi:DNA topoisomerase-1